MKLFEWIFQLVAITLMMPIAVLMLFTITTVVIYEAILMSIFDLDFKHIKLISKRIEKGFDMMNEGIHYDL